MADLLSPPPDAPRPPEPRPCAAGFCETMVSASWLPFSSPPGWWQPRLCESCSATRTERESLERAEALRRKGLRDRLQTAGLAHGLQAMTFDTFRSEPGTESAIAAARTFAAAAAEALPQRGIMFVGVNGSGKTHLGAAILRHVLDGNYRVSGAFVRFSTYLRLIVRSLDGDRGSGAEELRSTMRTVDLLVLDDIGAAAERARRWDREELVELLEERALRRRPLITSTDLNEDALAEHLGNRVVSRLYGICEMVPMAEGEIEAGDFRRREQGGREDV